MEINLTHIDLEQALRYLGYRDTGLDDRIMAQLKQAEGRVLALARPRTVYRLFGMEPRPSGIGLTGAAFTLEGGDIAAHLAGCSQVVLMAATLGAELEEEIRRAQVTDMALAMMLDACADSAIEQVCDLLGEKLAEQLGAKGLDLTSRFSPGYGDMPLHQQAGFCQVLDTARRIGLHVSDTHLLMPRKSVTAVMGVGVNVTGKLAGCETCAMADSCQFRKAGKTCGK